MSSLNDTHDRHDAARIEAAVSRGPAESSFKRAMDICVAATALVTFLPLLLLVAVLIRLESSGPVIFRQRRSGLAGRPFTILKFRTMYVADEAGAVRQACANDTRVTRIGRVLRRMSIDELPQLLNILKGDMSLIGPRPHALGHDAQWQEITPSYRLRFRARPGLTGLAQVNGHRGEVYSDRCVRARIEADNRYIDSWSIPLDVRIFCQTVSMLFRDPNAY